MGYAQDLTRVYMDAVPKKVTRAAAALPQAAEADNLFTISVGAVAVVLFIGRVTVQVGAVGNNTNITFNPTIGAAADMTAVLDITGRDVDTLFGVDTIATALNGIDNAGILEMPITTQWGSQGLAMFPGVIILNCAGSDGGGGRVEWLLWYVPLEANAYVTAAPYAPA